MIQTECEVCIMDDSDSDIQFFGKLGCNHCIEMNRLKEKAWSCNIDMPDKLAHLVTEIKEAGKGKKYDSILGISGGLDSSYLALKAYEWGLRPLLFHVDAGWNTEFAVRNIQSIVDYTGWDLITDVIDWEDMKKLHIAYLKSGVTNQDVPQDHAYFASLYNKAESLGIKHVLSGGNFATEGIFPKSWHRVSSMDSKNLKYIYKNFGTEKLFSYPTISFFKLYFYLPYIAGVRTVRPLDLIKYNVKKAKKELIDKTGWRDYPRKHSESSFTRLFQEYYLIKRCGFDKKRPHYSSLIVSNQITKIDAHKMLMQETYSVSELKRDLKFLAGKLEISESEFFEFMNLPINNALNMPNWSKKFNFLRNVRQILKKNT